VAAQGHEIPNARVDRSIQATAARGRLTIDYEVSLAELTLTQDLRALLGELPGADRRAWFEVYGRETGPLNAQGILVAVDGQAHPLQAKGFDLVVEDHPRYTFHFETPIPPRGRLAIQDTNFASSEGTSRLALRGLAGVTVQGDNLPADVTQIPIRPIWELSDAEELRTRQVVADYQAATVPAPPDGSDQPSAISGPPEKRGEARLTQLLDRDRGLSLAVLLLVAFGLGAAHSVQPGHGKTLVAATVLGDRGSWLRGALLALVTTVTHTGSVLLIAAALWWTRSSRFAEIHLGLAHVAGFVIAAIGLWRLGRHLAGLGEHDGGFDSDLEPARPSKRGLVGLGVAGGLVPCWDAVGLIVLAQAWGKLALGLLLLLAFSLGMALVLVLVGALAARFRRWVELLEGESTWERRLGIASGLVLTAIGIYLMGLSS
jgi:nickel/cobalt transporter (NicO) family protein